MESKVVITGIGVVTPLGCKNTEYRERLLQGESAAKPITIFDPASLATTIAAQVDEKNIAIETKDRKISFALIASENAIQDASRQGTPLREFYSTQNEESALSIGLGLELFSMPDMVYYLEHQKPPAEAEKFTFLQTPSDICAHQISYRQDFKQPPQIHISACAASTDAIGMAFHQVQRNTKSWMLAGGTDSMINPMGVGGFCAIKAMTMRNQDPQKASRPFDRDRDGFLLGEGGAFFILETLENAKKRNAFIYAEIIGYGNSFDAHGISEPHPDGTGALLAMKRALKQANISAAELTYINAHGTSTPKNDVTESIAIEKLLGEQKKEVWVSSTKSMIGHLISASGAAEVAAMLLCAENGWLHPSINIENQDPSCSLRLVKNQAQKVTGKYFLKNSFAFGGQNAALVFKIPSFS